MMKPVRRLRFQMPSGRSIPVGLDHGPSLECRMRYTSRRTRLSSMLVRRDSSQTKDHTETDRSNRRRTAHEMRVETSRDKGGFGNFEMLKSRGTDCTTAQKTCVGVPEHLRSSSSSKARRTHDPSSGFSDSSRGFQRRVQPQATDAHLGRLRSTQCERTATHTSHHRVQLRENASEPRKIMG